MDFGSDPQVEQLREEARAFVAEQLTAEVIARVRATGNYHDADFHRALAAKGWIGGHWSEDEGGRGWPRAFTDVVYEELAAAGAPVEGWIITQIIGEAIRREGSSEMKEQFLPLVTRGEVLFALGYSEPGSGSDLASVQTKAVRDGDGWIVNGQKIFTTMGSEADYVFLLTRTEFDGPKHAGLTLFLVPTASPGFEASGLFTLSGQRTNVTHYTDIRIEDSTRIGDRGRGWEIVNVALAFERGGEFAAQLRRLVTAAVEWGKATGRDADPRFLARLGRTEALTRVARLLGGYASWSRSQPGAGAVEGTIAKVFGTEALQTQTRALLQVAGADGLVDIGTTGATLAGELQHLYRESHIATIYGGTSEVLKSLIAQQRLTLPRTRRG